MLSEQILDGCPKRIKDKIRSCARAGTGFETNLDKPLEIPAKAKMRLGGQAGNSANAFGNLGVPTVCNAPVSGRLRKFFSRNVELVGSEGPPAVHIVLEWRAGGFLRAKRDNRAILTHDPDAAGGRIFPKFERRAASELRAGNVGVALVGGIHLARSFSGPAALARKILKAGVPVHLEFGSCPKAFALRAIRKARGSFSSFGCNEEEAEELGRDKLMKLTGAGRVIIHGRDFVEIAYSRKAWPYSKELEEQAAGFASAVAATKGVLGHDPCREEVGCVIENGMIERRDGPCSSECSGDIVRIIAPAWKARKLKASVGLGDSFIAAFLAYELDL